MKNKSYDYIFGNGKFNTWFNIIVSIISCSAISFCLTELLFSFDFKVSFQKALIFTILFVIFLLLFYYFIKQRTYKLFDQKITYGFRERKILYADIHSLVFTLSSRPKGIYDIGLGEPYLYIKENGKKKYICNITIYLAYPSVIQKRYETFHVPVKYPFGYGLSYTSFSYSELNVPEVYSGGKIQIRFKIKNIGKVSGAEIAQLYICPIESDVIRSHIELKGFQKIYLHPGEEKEVILELDERSFSVYDVEKKAFSMLSGKYQICIGASVHDLQLKANMEVVGNSYFRNERELFPDYFREQPHGMEISAEQFYQLLGGEPKHDKEKKRGEYTVYDSYQDVVNVSMFGKFVRGVVHIGLKIILRGKSERDPAFKMVKMGVEEGNLEGLIATSGGIATPKLIDMLVYNANKKYLQAFKRLLKK